MSDYSSKTRDELIAICKEHGLKGYSGKKKSDLIDLLVGNPVETAIIEPKVVSLEPEVKLIRKKKEKKVEVEEETKARGGAGAETAKLRMIDLFAGTGAFTHAFQKTGSVECVFANDMVEWSKKIYDENFTHKLTLGNLNDIKETDIPTHDILTGGFPCQPFSIAGKQEGFDDERSNVFWKILRIIDHHKPKCVVLENVKNLVSHDEGRTFETIKKNLTDRGYHICFKVLNTSSITGVPQHRERIYIVCFRDKATYDKFTLDFEPVTKKPIRDYLEKDITDKYYYTESSSTWPLVSESVTKTDTIYQYRRVYVRENKSSECPTLTANMGGGGHNVPIVLDKKGIRKLTPRETFNFQGFPKEYKLPKISDTNLYKLAGNAVSVPVVELIAKRLVPLLI
jgi:DNA (cytosine-5)-methyltransferase 1